MTATARPSRLSALREFAPWRRVWIELAWATVAGLASTITGIIAPKRSDSRPAIGCNRSMTIRATVIMREAVARSNPLVLAYSFQRYITGRCRNANGVACFQVRRFFKYSIAGIHFIRCFGVMQGQ